MTPETNTNSEIIKPKPNYWKVSTIGLLIIFFIFVIFSTVKFYNQELTTFSDSKISPTFIPTISPVNQTIKETFTYPSNLSILSKGEATIDSDHLFENKYFTLILQRFPEGTTTFPKEKYKIPLSNMDYVGEPRVSYNQKYGCVTSQASGYIGYYIFSIPDGQNIEQGEQYSQCTEWINDHQVIIVENIYNTSKISYYVFDAITKSKKILSTLSNE